MKSQVVLLSCPIYDREKIYEELKWGIEQIGGIAHFVQKEEKILLKPNFLRKADKDSAITTHPYVMSAVARLLRENSCEHISYGDSAGFGSMEKIAEECGVAEEMRALKIPIANFEESVFVKYPQGKMAKQFHLAKAVVDNDALINVCKMKTHQLERITAAVKNMYGCIQGLHKAKGHTIYNNAESFARMLVDLNMYVKPRLHIMDGIVAMEGNGPAGGDPVHMGVMLVSTDPVALDSVVCSLMNLEADLVPTNVQGEKMGLGTWRSENIEVITREGVRPVAQVKERFGKPDYKVNRGKEVKKLWRNIRFIARHFQRKPYIVEKDCIRCGICVDACPVDGKALVLNKPNAPVYDYKKCIACFCCQEMCPQKAIKVK